jgi:Ni,Fe-hydrogenase I cytochrome b subunit
MRTSRSDDSHATPVAQVRPEKARARFLRRTVVHLLAFVASFVFSAGIAVLCMLLFVHNSEDIARLVIVSLISGGVFVAGFAAIRMFILHSLFDEYPDKEEDPGLHHHIAKSIAYGFVALALALLVAGFIIYITPGFSAR